MSLSKETQFYEWLFGRAEFPFWKEPLHIEPPEGFETEYMEDDNDEWRTWDEDQLGVKDEEL